ncbi:hypothetical protein ABZT28_39650 [Streptomyces sp. NPDC005388]|uniref:hypothetical protein n=1 Tax=Streptomyces sp. NPDC005388 TaxID=3156717 RepID=UPI00339E8AD2
MPSPHSDIVVRPRLLSFLLTAALAFVALVPVATPAAAATQVCVLACDTLDPSQARQESFPVPDKNLNGRRLELHVSDADDMAWASIDNGVTGDSVWLDRSWDGGATWEGLLGKASIPGTWTGTRTLMYNITDPRHHRRGLVRACGDAAGVGCTNWAYPTVCDTLCDGTDAGKAAGDDQPVPSTTLYGRTIRLHVDQMNSMAWASIDTGGAGDEIWLDLAGRLLTRPHQHSVRGHRHPYRDVRHPRSARAPLRRCRPRLRPGGEPQRGQLHRVGQARADQDRRGGRRADVLVRPLQRLVAEQLVELRRHPHRARRLLPGHRQARL